MIFITFCTVLILVDLKNTLVRNVYDKIVGKLKKGKRELYNRPSSTLPPPLPPLLPLWSNKRKQNSDALKLELIFALLHKIRKKPKNG